MLCSAMPGDAAGKTRAAATPSPPAPRAGLTPSRGPLCLPPQEAWAPGAGAPPRGPSVELGASAPRDKPRAAFLPPAARASRAPRAPGPGDNAGAAPPSATQPRASCCIPCAALPGARGPRPRRASGTEPPPARRRRRRRRRRRHAGCLPLGPALEEPLGHARTAGTLVTRTGGARAANALGTASAGTAGEAATWAAGRPRPSGATRAASATWRREPPAAGAVLRGSDGPAGSRPSSGPGGRGSRDDAAHLANGGRAAASPPQAGGDAESSRGLSATRARPGPRRRGKPTGRGGLRLVPDRRRARAGREVLARTGRPRGLARKARSGRRGRCADGREARRQAGRSRTRTPRPPGRTVPPTHSPGRRRRGAPGLATEQPRPSPGPGPPPAEEAPRGPSRPASPGWKCRGERGRHRRVQRGSPRALGWVAGGRGQVHPDRGRGEGRGPQRPGAVHVAAALPWEDGRTDG